jgi:signal transduction histidine kinase
MEISIYSTIVFIVVVIEFSLATIVFLGSKRYSAKVFSALILLHALWTTIEAIFHGTTDLGVANFLVLYTHFLGGVIASAFFYFTLTYPENKHPSNKILLGIIFFQLIALLAYGQGWVVGEVFSLDQPQRWGWYWGSFAALFHITFFGFWSAGLFTLYKKLRRSSGEDRTNLRFMLAAMSVSVIPVSVIIILLPAINIFTFGWLGAITSLAWVAVLAFSIIKRHNMNVRAVLAEIFVLAAGIILFVNIFVGGSGNAENLISPETVLRTIIFVAFFVVGYLLIVNILKETEQKERIERLNKELGALNAELEEKVEGRTKELNISKKHIEIILENLTIGIVEYDARFSVLRINEATEQILGVNRADVINRTIAPKEEGVGRSLSKIMYDWQSEKSSGSELGDITYNEIKVEYPKHRELQVVTIPIRVIPFIKISGFVKLLRDVTHERAVDRGKSDFISIVAHQLSAPLEVTGWALERILSEKLTDKQEELLLKTQTSNANLTQIANDLLNAARIDAGEFKPVLKKNNVEDMIAAQLKHFKTTAQQKNIDLTFNNRATKLPSFSFDREKMNLVLRNILTNALDYTPSGGRVVVTLEHSHDGFVSIIVQDSGIGIPKEDLDRIFTKFYRSKDALLMETDRSGLGLYISKHIIDGHKGTIAIESEQGAGVTVTIRIPVSSELS